jgi:riboflavin biosynthesis pyrimidine reductase
MRQLFPETAEVDVVTAYAADDRPPPEDRPWVLLNMITSIDGATAVDGLSGGLGGPADKEVFRAIRAVADVILVAAGTLRAEQYGPVRANAAVQRLRRARGQAPIPRLAVVTASLELDVTTPVFADADRPPIVFTTTAAVARRGDAVASGCDLRASDGPRVDLGAALRALRHDDGAAVVLVEGGPSINGTLTESGLVDEVCLSLAPLLVGGPSARLAHGAQTGPPEALELRRVLTADGLLFLRYAR